MEAKVTFFQKFRRYIWDNDDKSPEERRLVRKLDFGILICCCFGWFMKSIDQSNLAKAYVSGMKEDLGIFGNEYTLMGTMYTIAYAIMQVPSTMIVQKVRPSWWLAFCEIGWGVWTFAQAGVTNSRQMYAFRFLVGLFESSFFPCMLFLMGSWYNKHELAKRACIMHMTGSLGAAFSGYLQAAIYSTLDGRLGIAGWRWLYIICGCMTLPCGIAIFCLLPDFPTNTRVWYLTPEERVLALERCANAQKAKPQPLSWNIIKRVFGRWHWYLFVLGYVLYGTGCQASSYFAIWLKAQGYSVDYRNVIPSCADLISAFAIFMWGFLSDLTAQRFTWVFIPLLYSLIPNGILAVYPKSNPLKQFAFMTGGVQLMTAVFYSWLQEVCRHDNEERALVLSSCNGMQYMVAAWMPLIIFLQTDGPTFRKGFPATFGFCIAALFIMVAIKILADRDEKIYALEGGRPVGLEEGVEERVSAEDDVKDEKAGEAVAVLPVLQVQK